jgi:hypothetical protein
LVLQRKIRQIMATHDWTQARFVKEMGWRRGGAGTLSLFLNHGSTGVPESSRATFLQLLLQFVGGQQMDVVNSNNHHSPAVATTSHGTCDGGVGVGVGDVSDRGVWADMDLQAGAGVGVATSGGAQASHGITGVSVDGLAAPGGFRTALQHYILPALRRFEPELILISAGFDGMASDPLGGQLGLVAEDYAWATRAIVRAAGELESCRGRLVSVLEGGYDLRKETCGLSQAVQAHVRELMRDSEQ